MAEAACLSSQCYVGQTMIYRMGWLLGVIERGYLEDGCMRRVISTLPRLGGIAGVCLNSHTAPRCQSNSVLGFTYVPIFETVRR